MIKNILPVACALSVFAYPLANLYVSVVDLSVSFAMRVSAEAFNSTLDYVGVRLEPKQHHIPTLVEYAAKSYNINPKLLDALIHQESGHNPEARSSKGAIGLTQIMPFNAKRCGHSDASDLWNKRNNVMCGAKILAEELKTYKGDLTKALQAYNGGPKCIGRCDESIKYSRSITHAFAQKLIQTSTSQS